MDTFKYIVYLLTISVISPFVRWFGNIKLPFLHKKINGKHYYLVRDSIEVGSVFLTTVKGEPSNLINPCKYKHGALYFGRGLKTDINDRIKRLKERKDLSPQEQKEVDEQILRLIQFLKNNSINDTVCYVIEAIGKGVVATDLVTFLTTKDIFLCLMPIFANEAQRKQVVLASLEFLSLPYDYLFRIKDVIKFKFLWFKKTVVNERAMYCFESVIKSYLKVFPQLQVKKSELLGVEKYDDSTFIDDTVNWKIVIDSEIIKL